MRERSPGRWELRVFLGSDPDTGKKQYVSRIVMGGKRLASSELARLVAAEPGDVKPQRRGQAKMTLSELIDEHIERHPGSPTTLTEYRAAHNRYIRDHFQATMLRRTGLPVKDVSKRIGHRDAATSLNVYAHVPEPTDRRSANVLGISSTGQRQQRRRFGVGRAAQRSPAPRTLAADPSSAMRPDRGATTRGFRRRRRSLGVDLMFGLSTARRSIPRTSGTTPTRSRKGGLCPSSSSMVRDRDRAVDRSALIN